jgi:hypothetical protein
MQIELNSGVQTQTKENFAIIQIAMNLISGITKIDEAYEKLVSNWRPVMWEVGRGANHIWIAQHGSERLMLIKE